MPFRFLRSDAAERPATEFLVLTLVLFGTGLGIVSGTGSNAASATLTIEEQHGLDAVARSNSICRGGVEALQEAENARVVAAIVDGKDAKALDVFAYKDTYLSVSDDEDLLRQYRRSLVSNSFERPDGRQKTIARAVECELKDRGFL